MRQFKCSICGYTYDEAVGIPEKGIAPGTKWEDLPHDFVCPWCGAEKSVFEEVKKEVEEAVKEAVKEETKNAVNREAGNEQPPVTEQEAMDDLRELSPGELSALCSNLARGCEKQHLTQEMNLFQQLAEYYKERISGISNMTLEAVTGLLRGNLSQDYAAVNQIAAANADRGALRALVWGEKVSRMLVSLLDRYAREGEAMLEDTKIYVCDICGFVYVGNTLPEICPVCKVPNYKILPVERR